MFPTYQYLQKDVWEFFKFCLDLELFAKIKKIDTPMDPVFLTISLKTQDLNKKES